MAGKYVYEARPALAALPDPPSALSRPLETVEDAEAAFAELDYQLGVEYDAEQAEMDEA
jgi:hypothetical protein